MKRSLWKWSAGIVCAALELLSVPLLRAADTSAPPDLISSSLKTLGALVIVLVIIFIIAWAAKRYLHFLPNVGSKTDAIRLLATKPLGTKRSLHLLEIEGSKFLIGSSENNVTLLKEWDQDKS